jgi:hypothetical protein
MTNAISARTAFRETTKEVSNGAVPMPGREIDREAVKRLLNDFRGRLQTLDCDLCSLLRALDGPVGAVAELAQEVIDRDMYIDRFDIRDILSELDKRRPNSIPVGGAEFGALGE